MNRTTPPLLSSTSCFRVVFKPSLVSISPPNPSRVMVSPTEALVALLVLVAFGLTASLTFAITFATGPFFFAGGAATGSEAGALRFLNSGGILRGVESACDEGVVVVELSVVIGAAKMPSSSEWG